MVYEKSKISANVVADSEWEGSRITTLVLKYPRFIHSELMTHRAFSRNAASSRAIPSHKIIEQVKYDPAMPIHWGKLQKGMQAEEQVDDKTKEIAILLWRLQAEQACVTVQQLLDRGIHKQIANRLLEPWMWMTSIVTATDFNNFFNLRVHKDAQPEFQVLAYRALEARESSQPKQTSKHRPFGDKYLEEGLTDEQIIKICVARCARVSYLNFEGDMAYEKDYALHDGLVANGHMSPLEHVADRHLDVYHGNFYGWKQYRKSIPYENKTYFNKEELISRVQEFVLSNEI